ARAPRTPRPTNKPGTRPPWLPPYKDQRAWRQDTWGQIVLLHARYSQALEHLPDEWWQYQTHTETLSALATWRAEIDNHAQDPREELAFHNQLNTYTNTLQRQSNITTTWNPNMPPPPEWTDH
ncbi:MAG: hypothetical protein ACREKE_06210, partial [bacterium]